MWIFGRKGASGFSACSTAEEVARGIDGSGLTAIVTGQFSLTSVLNQNLLYSDHCLKVLFDDCCCFFLFNHLFLFLDESITEWCTSIFILSFDLLLDHDSGVCVWLECFVKVIVLFLNPDWCCYCWCLCIGNEAINQVFYLLPRYVLWVKKMIYQEHHKSEGLVFVELRSFYVDLNWWTVEVPGW